jgi:hypothetical protein
MVCTIIFEEIVGTTKVMYIIMCLEYVKTSKRACCGSPKHIPTILPINVCSKYRMFHFPAWSISAALTLRQTACQRFVSRHLSGSFKADSHIACRSHAVPLPCRAAKILECVFPI